MVSPVEVTRNGHVLEVKLNKPKVNAIDHAMSRDMGKAFALLRDDPELRVGILTAEGERIFSAGWDLKALNSGSIKLDNWWEDGDYGDGGFAGLTENWNLNKPVIAAINGLAIGGGFEIALSCDLIIAAQHAEFALPEMPLGIVPDAGALQRLPRRLPYNIAMEMLLLGRRMGAEEAARYGSYLMLEFGRWDAARGWTKEGGDLWEVLARLEDAGCARYVVTDVAKDGTLQGPNLDLLREVCAATDRPVIASGGVSSLDDLRAVHEAVDTPVLRKDFLFTEYQLWEARASGADAALLIVSALASPLGNPDDLDEAPVGAEPDLAVAHDRLGRLMRVARKAGLEVLVEVHDAAEAAVAADLRAPVIGINNRNLATFATSLATTEEVVSSLALQPGHNPVIVSESGLHDGADVSRVRRAGAHAVLVGEALVRAVDPAAKAREILDGVSPAAIRKSDSLRETMRANLEGIKNEMDQLVVKRGRKIVLD